MLLDITDNDINSLNDTDLRSLVGKLCEAELHSQQLPTAGVTWGGDQNAPDGGIDVRVELSAKINEDGFIPRSITGYQVKKPKMSASKIREEMRPNGELRTVIRDLVNVKGAYIIISAESTSDSSLKERKKAMSEALSDIENRDDIKLDFYDRNRIATWVNSNPALILWIKEKIGHPIQGWKPFGNWANPKADINEEYLLDDGMRLYEPNNKHQNGMTVIDGINVLRTRLLNSTTSIRLAGLSGVGKTRLLQALFDDRIGNNPLPYSQVYYTDMGDKPSPSPENFTSQLLNLNKKAILIVDNCPPDLHRILTNTCLKLGSLVKLITVEYDVCDDLPEETDVFRLEPSTIELIEKLIRIRFKHINISQIDSRTIAEFSGGNARIAIALANTVNKGESLSSLKDEELFKRLFNQRNDVNDNLMKSAEVCALVYSFNCKKMENNDELSLLASLINLSREQLFRHVTMLKQRDLIQQRDIWRAVLPHAIANRLAKQALENIPPETIQYAFEQNGRGFERLLKSFSKRLSYLHDSEPAKEISKRWLAEKGLLSDISNLSKLGIDLLSNIAPVAPKETLIAIERAANGNNGQQFTSRDNPHFIWLTRLLRSLAYDANLFDRCVAILCRFALSEKSNEKSNSIRDLLKSLFWLYLSGTHATAEQRLQIVKKLCESNDESEKELGLLLLSGVLEAWHFSSFYGFDFGARPRDYGYEPATYGEISDWYALFINFSTTLAISQNSIACDVQNLLAEKFRVLWTRGVFNEIEIMANAIIEKNPWSEGWIAVKKIIGFDAKEMSPDILDRLKKLEYTLAPKNLVERANAYVFGNSTFYFDLIDSDESDDYNKKLKNIEKILIQIGKDVVNDQNVFELLLPEAVTNQSYGNKLFDFGKGLAAGCSNEHLAIWAKFRHQLSTVESIQRSYSVLLGFFSELSLTHSDVAQKILDDAVSDEILSECYPSLQFLVEMDQQGLQRLKQSLNNESLPARLYYGLARFVSDSIDDDSLCDMIKNIASKKDGLEVAITVLRDLASNYDKHSHSEIISNLVCDLLVKVDFDQQNNMDNYYLSELIKIYLVSEKSASTAKIICEKLSKKLSDYNSNPHQHWELLKSLAEAHPKVCLDIFLDGDKKFYFDELNYKKWLLSHINNETIINWCEINSTIRYPKIVNFINAYQFDKETNIPELSPLFLNIIDKAPNVIEVLDSFKTTFRPMCWSGSRADIMEKNLSLIIQLKKNENKEVSTWANGEEKLLINEIEWEREREENYNRTRDERFEW